MIKRITTIVLGIVVLLVAVQPKLLVHFCGDHFIALYLNQDPAAVKSACGGSAKRHASVAGQADNCLVQSQEVALAESLNYRNTNNQLAITKLSSEQLTDPRIADLCPQRQLTVVDVAVDEFIAAPPPTYNFSFEWQAVTLFLPMLAHYLLPQEEGVYLLCSKAPPYSPLPLTGRDILLRHATLLI